MALGKSVDDWLVGQAMTFLSTPLTFMSVTLQPQVEDFQNENRKFGSGCEYAIQSLRPFFLQYKAQWLRMFRLDLQN